MIEVNAAKPPKPEQQKKNYKPYSLKEYKERHLDPSAYRMGGLGANIGTEEWEKQNNKVQAMKEFASKVKIENRARSMNPPKQRKEIEKEKSKREKAIEFAKNVPKPKQPIKKVPKIQKQVSQKQNDDFGIDDMEFQPEEPKYSEYELLNQKHEEFLNEVNDIKRLFM